MADDDDLEGVDDLSALRREAAQRRHQLREAEAERDALRVRVDSSDRREVERLASDRFTDPTDVWAVTSLEQLRGDDGALSLDRAESEFGRIEEAKPHWRKVEPEPVKPQLPNLHNGARRSVEERPKVSFGEALRDSRSGA